MRALVLLICLIFLTNPSFNQISDSVVDTNRIWYTHIYIYCCWQIDTEVLGIGQDTTNDTIYHRVLRTTGGFEIPNRKKGEIYTLLSL